MLFILPSRNRSEWSSVLTAYLLSPCCSSRWRSSSIIWLKAASCPELTTFLTPSARKTLGGEGAWPRSRCPFSRQRPSSAPFGNNVLNRCLPHELSLIPDANAPVAGALIKGPQEFSAKI
jgi:hypothetical protein